ncbi:AMP-binding protein [Mycolicibacterium stellerae]|uniref:AMP-binding protein n=1 Tax=Mycolicibacterium stellerae TaxID=2358193 RepID=UPI000F0B1DF0|nr:AMP-binding protein [Mycolicibacterium stellerae]
MAEASLTSLLQERATRTPDATAYTFMDYDVDPNGFAESLTWAELLRAAECLADELTTCGSAGDRAAIVAPQGLGYVISFFGAIQAGFIAVPLSVPQYGVHDERVSSVLQDCAPTVILTTSAAVDAVTPYAQDHGRNAAPVVVDVDSLDLASPRGSGAGKVPVNTAAYLQYTSGSTRSPAGVVVTHKNVIVNVEQALADYFGESIREDTTFVSWLPLYHDMGLIKGICTPLVCGREGVLMSPMAFLQRPARWIQLLATHPGCFSAAPNFAFELAARRTSDEDMAGLDLGDVHAICSGAERVHAATFKRFTDRFAQFNLKQSTLRPSYGLAEATVYVATSNNGQPPSVARFDYEKLSSGHAKRCENELVGSTDLIGHGSVRSTMMRIVDPASGTENPAGKVGEIWVHGDNVAKGYWKKPSETQRVFGARLVNSSPGTPEAPWLRTGDLGVISEGELFIIGRIKDLLIVDGSNHYPDDIESTITEISKGRSAAISITEDQTEKLVAIVEVKKRAESDEEFGTRLRTLKRELTSAISNVHRLRVTDLVFVPPGSLPITTSGKVRRSTCAELYKRNEFERVDITS